jgi:VIT1/CCC1 family predicted Fe2+/Mn2+ transporter
MESVHDLFLAALIVSFVAVFASLFASNFYLGQAHNAIETDKIIRLRRKEEIVQDSLRDESQVKEEKDRE